MNYRTKFNIQEVSLVILFTIIIAYFLSFIYPYPYFLAGGFSGESAYDGEPDYFANIVSSFINGHSMDFLHPGIPIVLLCKSMLVLFRDIYTVEEIIASSRFLLISINFLMIYIGSRIILRHELSIFFLILSLLILFPAGFVLVDHLSPNGILFGVSILVVALGYKLDEGSKLYLLLFSIFLGLAVAIKFPAIVLGIPFYISLLLSEIGQEKFLRKLFLSLVVTSLSFSIFTWPVLPFIPFFLTHHNYSYADFEFIFSNLYISLFLISLFLGVLIYLVTKLKRVYNFNYKNIYKTVCISFLLFLLITMCIKAWSADDYLSFSYSLRNYIPLLGMLILVIGLPLPKKVFNSRFNLHVFFIVFLLILSIKFNFNYLSDKRAQNLDTSFSNLYSLYINQYDNIVLYPAGSFASKDIFLAWSDYRYGDSRYLFIDQENKLPFKMTENQRKIRVLNTRKFDLNNPLTRVSYQYFQKSLDSKFFSKNQKGVASNQINLQDPKEICNQIYDGYVQGSTSLAIIPLSLHSYIANNGLKDIDLAYNYVNSLKDRLTNKCKLDTEIKSIIHDSQKFYLLSIK
tara:strand:- start:867 stop:2582 length:1716 start_codon:yes stop_codon:yes gene_type:complete